MCTKCRVLHILFMGCDIMYEVYNVKKGDTIEKIISMYNITLDDLVKVNGIIDLSNLYEGMKIMIPNDDSNPYRYYTVKKGDTIKEIADKYNIDYNMLIKINGLEEVDYIYQNQTILVPKEGVSLYLTKDNDSINSILNELGLSIFELLENNKSIYLRENQVIVF